MALNLAISISQLEQYASRVLWGNSSGTNIGTKSALHRTISDSFHIHTESPSQADCVRCYFLASPTDRHDEDLGPGGVATACQSVCCGKGKAPDFNVASTTTGTRRLSVFGARYLIRLRIRAPSQYPIPKICPLPPHSSRSLFSEDTREKTR